MLFLLFCIYITHLLNILFQRNNEIFFLLFPFQLGTLLYDFHLFSNLKTTFAVIQRLESDSRMFLNEQIKMHFKAKKKERHLSRDRLLLFSLTCNLDSLRPKRQFNRQVTKTNMYNEIKEGLSIHLCGTPENFKGSWQNPSYVKQLEALHHLYVWKSWKSPEVLIVLSTRCKRLDIVNSRTGNLSKTANFKRTETGTISG